MMISSMASCQSGNRGGVLHRMWRRGVSSPLLPYRLSLKYEPGTQQTVDTRDVAATAFYENGD